MNIKYMFVKKKRDDPMPLIFYRSSGRGCEFQTFQEFNEGLEGMWVREMQVKNKGALQRMMDKSFEVVSKRIRSERIECDGKEAVEKEEHANNLEALIKEKDALKRKIKALKEKTIANDEESSASSRTTTVDHKTLEEAAAQGEWNMQSPKAEDKKE